MWRRKADSPWLRGERDWKQHVCTPGSLLPLTPSYPQGLIGSASRYYHPHIFLLILQQSSFPETPSLSPRAPSTRNASCLPILPLSQGHSHPSSCSVSGVQQLPHPPRWRDYLVWTHTEDQRKTGQGTVDHRVSCGSVGAMLLQ